MRKLFHLTLLPALWALPVATAWAQPVISSSLAETGYAQTIPFLYTIVASNSPTSLGAAGLPPGLSVNSQTGVISGIPTAVGVFQITLTASNLAGSGSATLSLTIDPPPYYVSELNMAPAVPFSDLAGIVSVGSDLLYIADNGNSTIYKFKPSTLTATVFAGTTGVTGTSDGAGTAAKFNRPEGLAVDASGNVYVADTASSTIRKISSAGVVTTLAGVPGEPGSSDGAGTAAHFNYPQSIAVDSSGNVFVADTNNFTIRRISPSGTVTTVAGTVGRSLIADGTGSAAGFGGPNALVIDSMGNLFVEDVAFESSAIREVNTTTGAVVSIFALGKSSDGSLSSLAIDSSDNLYFYNPELIFWNIEEVTPSGEMYSLGPLYSTGPLSDSFVPNAMAFDPSGHIFETTPSSIYEGVPAYGPTIVSQPTIVESSIALEPGEAEAIATISVSVDALPQAGSSLSYQWLLNGSPVYQGSIPGESDTPRGSLVTLINAGTMGTYSVLISDANGGVVMSEGVTLTPLPLWTIATQPASQSVLSGASAAFSVTTSGTAAPIYQWTFNGVAIAGATGASYSVSGAKAANSGAYAVTVTDGASSVTSQSTFLTVTGSSGNPTIAAQPQSYTAASGGTVVLTVGLSTSQASVAGIHPTTHAAPAVTYQWYFNGITLSDGGGISGSQTATLVLSGEAAEPGGYVCLVENSAGSVLSATATLSVSQTADIGRMTNVSCRALVGKGSSNLIAGFIVGGSGTSGLEPLLIRGAGPALVPFDVPGTIADPELQLFSTASGTDMLAINTGWGGDSPIVSAAESVGAFAWASPSSHDTALLEALGPGPYTANISGEAGDSGVALAEVYDATPEGTYSATTPRLVNVSARVNVGTGGDILIAGFIVGGSTSTTVLIRASGPALAPFGVTGTLPDPQLQLYQSNGDGTSTLFASNTGWAGNAEIAAEAAAVGAFSWGSSATADSALLVTLRPGVYTAQVSGATSDTGVALVEVYEAQ